MKTKYSEVRNTFFDDYNKVWCIDAWKTGEAEEEGKVVAEVTLDGVVKYNDLDVIMDELVQAKIKERVFLCICDKVANKMKINFDSDYITSCYESDASIDFIISEAQIFNNTVYFILETSGDLTFNAKGKPNCFSEYSEANSICNEFNGFKDDLEKERAIETLKLDWIHSIKDVFSYNVLILLNRADTITCDIDVEKVYEDCFQYLTDNTLKNN